MPDDAYVPRRAEISYFHLSSLRISQASSFGTMLFCWIA